MFTLFRKGRWVQSKTTLFVFVALLLCGSILSSCKVEMGGKRGKKDDKKDLAAPITAEPISRGDISKYLRLNSVLKPIREINIFAQSAGTILDLYVEEGDIVSKDKQLLTLESSDQDLAAKRALARLEREKNNLSRAQELFNQNMLPEDEFQQIQLSVRDSELQLEQAELALHRTRITAPFKGFISERYVNSGSRIDPSRPLFKLVDDSEIQLEVWVNEADLGALQIGLIADVKKSSNSKQSYKAKLIRISPVVDPTFGKLKATFKLLDISSDLKPGQLVELYLVLETHSNVLIIPKRALVYESGIPTVYINYDNLAFRRLITLGLETGENVEVLGGIAEGELIIVDGQSTLRDSSKVKPVISIN